MAYKDVNYVFNKLFEKTKDNIDLDNPVFIKARLTYSNLDLNNPKRDMVKVPYWEGIMACIDNKVWTVEGDFGYEGHENAVLAMAIEDGKNFIDKGKAPGFGMDGYQADRFGTGFRVWLTANSIENLQFVKSTPELIEKYKKAPEKIQYTAHLCDFEYGVKETKIVEGTKISYDIPNVKTLEDAEKWVMKNHPAQFLGCSITSNISDVLAMAIPSYHAYEFHEMGYDFDYTTREGREALTRKYAENRGFEVGEFTYDLLDKALDDKETEEEQDGYDR